MNSKILSVYCFCTVMWILTKSVLAFGGPQNYFSPTIPAIVYSPSQLGYGQLTLMGVDSEVGAITKELIYCDSPAHSSVLPSSIPALSSNERQLIREESQLVYQIGMAILNKPQSKIEELIQGKDLFYSANHKFKRFIFSSNKEAWNNESKEMQILGEKILYLQNQFRPEENIKAVLMLDVLNKKREQGYENLKYLLLRSFFLVDSEYRGKARNYIQSLLNLKDDGYSNFLNELNQQPFYDIGKTGYRLGRMIEKAHKNYSKGKKEDAYDEFYSYHRERIESFLAEISSENHPLIQDQLFSEGRLSRPSCLRPKLKINCHGMTRKGNTTSIDSSFNLEYFKAHRSYKILETKNGYKVSVSLKFKFQENIDKAEEVETLDRWKKWSMSFYNKNGGFQGKPVTFEFSFERENELRDEDEKVILVHRCWNASYGSSECHYPSQADAKNLTLDLKRDALLEEVGHHMGLTDEYQMPYYHLNPLGAKDSFMVAPENYRLYPHHIAMILAPHLLCRDNQ